MDTGAIKSQKINIMTRIANKKNSGFTILSQVEQTLMIAGDSGVVASFDVSTHELIDLWNLE